jgi:hypothetical protein
VSSLDERVLRTWAELAKTEGRFKNLQAILLGWQEHISMWLFNYLSSFPSLRQVIITDCPKIHQKNRKDWEPIALEYGWEARHGKRSAKSLRPTLNERGFHLGAVSGLLWSSSGIRKDEKDERVSRPVLEFWLGTPRTWTHILDDFPGTRTVFFDRPQQSTKEDRTVQSSIDPDLVKRARNMEQRSTEMSSPPPKRKLKSGLKMRAGVKGAADLLAEFTKE